jgi:hypothetical protein
VTGVSLRGERRWGASGHCDDGDGPSGRRTGDVSSTAVGAVGAAVELQARRADGHPAERQRAQAAERGGERLGPGPLARQPQPRAPPRAHHPPGGVHQASGSARRRCRRSRPAPARPACGAKPRKGRLPSPVSFAQRMRSRGRGGGGAARARRCPSAGALRTQVQRWRSRSVKPGWAEYSRVRGAPTPYRPDARDRLCRPGDSSAASCFEAADRTSGSACRRGSSATSASNSDYESACGLREDSTATTNLPDFVG